MPIGRSLTSAEYCTPLPTRGTTNGVAIPPEMVTVTLVTSPVVSFCPPTLTEAEPVSAFLPQPIIPLRATAPSAAAIHVI